MTTEKPLTIGELAKRANVSTSLLRYYEKEQLLQPSGRTQAGYGQPQHRGFQTDEGMSGAELRHFVARIFRAHPAIKAIEQRTPPVFSASHGMFRRERWHRPPNSLRERSVI